MEVNVTIDKEAVEQQIVQAILDSAIGQEIEKAIDEALKKPEGYSSNTLIVNAVREVVKDIIDNTIAESLRENKEFKERIRKLVEEITTDEALRSIITHIYVRD